VFGFVSNALDFSTVEIGDSIAVNGVCLTAIEVSGNGFSADVSQETLECSIFGVLSVDDVVNLEKALRLNQGIDGHLVSGHVDGQGKVVDKITEGKSVRFKINVPQSLVKYIARKGSITVNGVSLTVNSIEENEFDINIVPHTLSVTTLGQLTIGDVLNLEVDIIARHLEQLIKNKE
jgi:riboflavin synthase